MAEPVFAVLNQHEFVGSVGVIPVGIGTLASLEHDRVVVHGHVAVLYQEVAARVYVDRIARRCADGLLRGEDGEAEHPDVLALVEVRGPERGIDEMEAGHLHVPAVRHIQQARALFVLVRPVRIPFAPLPERFPEFEAVAVNRAGAADLHALQPIGIHDCGIVLARLSFDAGHHHRVVADPVASLETATFTYIQVHALFKEDGCREERAFRHHDHRLLSTGSKLPGLVDHPLYRLGLEDGRVRAHAIIREDELPAEPFQPGYGRILEPGIDGGAVRPQVRLHFRLLAGIRRRDSKYCCRDDGK